MTTHCDNCSKACNSEINITSEKDKPLFEVTDSEMLFFTVRLFCSRKCFKIFLLRSTIPNIVRYIKELLN
jgi:hypothetical protein